MRPLLRLVGPDETDSFLPSKGPLREGERTDGGMETARLAVKYVAQRLRRGEIEEDTARGIRYRLADFCDHVPTKPETIRRRHVAAWMERGDLSTGTLQLRLSAARGFCQWLALEGRIPLDPTLGVKAPRSPKRLPRNLHADESPRLVLTVPDARARLIVLLMLQEALRCKEVAEIQLGDIDWIRKVIDVRGKGGRGGVTRSIPMSDETLDALDLYLIDHPVAAGPLIRSYVKPGAGMGAKYISRLTAEWMQAAGIKRAPRDGKSAHACRHTAATDMVEAGVEIFLVQQALGHDSIASTLVYTRGATVDLRKAMGGRSYLNPPTDQRRTA